MLRRVLATLLILLSVLSQAHAFPMEEVGTSAAILLTQPGSSRLLAMGTGGTGAASGQEGLWWNPAALARYPFFNVEFSYRRHFEDTEIGYFGTSIPTGVGTFGVGNIFSQTTNIQGYDRFGNSTEAFSTRELSVKLGYAYQIDNFFLGAAVNFMQQDFYTGQTGGLAGDVGLVWEFRPGITVGAAVMHVGKTDLGDPFGMEIRYGFNAKVMDNMNLAYDLVLPRDNEIYLAGGAEWLLADFFAVRAGWRSGPGTPSNLGELVGFSAGAGFAWNNFVLDYVFEPSGVLESVHHVSFGYRFSEKPPEPTPTATAFVPAEPRLKIEGRAYEGKMVFIPKTSKKDFAVKGFRFKVKDKDGKVIRTFNYIGKAMPRKMVWDGKDEQGRKVKQSNFSFAFEYVTDKGVKIESQAWPIAEPVRKLWFKKGGKGVAAHARFRFVGALKEVKSWHLSIFERHTKKRVKTFTSKKALPKTIVWNGKDQQGRWAPANKEYKYQLTLIGKNGAKAILEDTIIAIPAKSLESQKGKTRFKILEILFEFNDAHLSARMGDKIKKAVDIYQTAGQKASIEIQGHADDVGTAWSNYNISRKRALEVKAHMRKLGIPSNWKLRIVGYGDDQPLERSQKEYIRARNRRVEIKIEFIK
jgi:outer membrane protein OmpA-like peptidoglycan-associated protein